MLPEIIEANYKKPLQGVPASSPEDLGIAGRIPDHLSLLWKRDGWAGYRDGLLWTINPIQFVEIIAMWPMVDALSVPIMRDAWGNLYLNSISGSADVLLVHDRQLVNLGIDTVSFIKWGAFDKMISSVYMRSSLARKAFARLGRISSDECLAFIPALSLGGSESIETVQKVPLMEHLAVLGQLA